MGDLEMKKILGINTAKKCEHFLGVTGAGEMSRMVVRAEGKKGNYVLH